MLLFIDNYDSFTHNLARYFARLGESVRVVRNDEISVADIQAIKPRALVISPGPCTPDTAGVSLAAIAACAGRVPILGVCLGHQAIGQVFGARVVGAKKVMHGKTSSIAHDDTGLFAGVQQQSLVTRYHSLVLEPTSLPCCLRVTAWTDDEGQRTIMGISHASLPLWGVQFHPESILSACGEQLLANFVNQINLFHGCQSQP